MLFEFAGDNTYAAGRSAAERILAQPDRPDCLFCVNDVVAIAAVDEATRCEIDVPDRLGIIGVDDIWMSATERYKLTTVEQPLDEMADEVVAFLVDKKDPKLAPQQPSLHKGTLCVRETTRA